MERLVDFFSSSIRIITLNLMNISLLFFQFGKSLTSVEKKNYKNHKKRCHCQLSFGTPCWLSTTFGDFFFAFLSLLWLSLSSYFTTLTCTIVRMYKFVIGTVACLCQSQMNTQIRVHSNHRVKWSFECVSSSHSMWVHLLWISLCVGLSTQPFQLEREYFALILFCVQETVDY